MSSGLQSRHPSGSQNDRVGHRHTDRNTYVVPSDMALHSLVALMHRNLQTSEGQRPPLAGRAGHGRQCREPGQNRRFA
jgi:hypothetical protein